MRLRVDAAQLQCDRGRVGGAELHGFGYRALRVAHVDAFENATHRRNVGRRGHDDDCVGARVDRNAIARVEPAKDARGSRRADDLHW